MTVKKSACRICAGQCALDVALDDQGRITSIRGDHDDPVSRGYACIKGLTLHEAHQSESRLLHPLRRRADGTFERVSFDNALDDIAERLQRISAVHGPNAIAGFKGTMNYTNFIANLLLPAFMRAIGSTAFYSQMTIDQSAKWVAVERLGVWGAGKDPFETADVLMMVGTNPLVSLATFNFALQNPVKQMRKAKARGMKLIVIDPRRTETAVHADLHLQPLPGEDSTVLAAILNVILERGWHDAEFCERYVDGLDELKAAIAPFSSERVEHRVGLSPGQITAAAAMFAEPIVTPVGTRRKRGSGASGAGPNMARNGNIFEHLLEALNVICGRFAREGEAVPHPGVIGPRKERRAQVYPPLRGWESAEDRSPSGYGRLFGERMTGALADDILCDAPDRVRAMIVDGGNPAISVPEPKRIGEALSKLDLLVTIDPFMTRTAALSDYILPPTMIFERYELGSRDYEGITSFAPYAQYTKPIVAPPEGSEVAHDWVILWEIARRMGNIIELDGEAMDMTTRPDDEAMIAHLLKRSAVPFEELKRSAAGKIYDVPPMAVLPADKDSGARFQLAPDDVIAEIEQLYIEVGNGEYPLRLACRRMREVQNTMYHHLATIHRRTPYNPLQLNPEDMRNLGIHDGENILVRSPYGELHAVARADDSLRPGVVTMTHGWDLSTGRDEKGRTANVNWLTSTTYDRDPINAMPVMSAIPVAVEPRARQKPTQPRARSQ